MCFAHSRDYRITSCEAHFAAPSVIATRYFLCKRVRILSGTLFALKEFPRKAKKDDFSSSFVHSQYVIPRVPFPTFWRLTDAKWVTSSSFLSSTANGGLTYSWYMESRKNKCRFKTAGSSYTPGYFLYLLYPIHIKNSSIYHRSTKIDKSYRNPLIFYIFLFFRHYHYMQNTKKNSPKWYHFREFLF